MSTEPNALPSPPTKEQLQAAVELLRAHGPTVLGAMFGGPAVLAGVDANTGEMSITTFAQSLADVFSVLLCASQHIGRHVGMDLQWVKAKPQGPQLFLPTGELPPPRRRG